ncbi:single-stranded DNA-binding protein [Microbacterium maritypicum]|uniref:Single-stranded DNA-binding protein n=1 Tax=Microbacterium maritypicum TaxID=33918 RepID=A0A4Y4BB15_MICMQ|nr:single-stranded DNA-binding protein [Microbacterium liquefaciens]GEC76702.1 single-stranded DNA-binding protein [Microbacterium liquefaciens]GGV61944.1 single-stranded DNA-binding protein [Microbacterium liquefaciens]
MSTITFAGNLTADPELRYTQNGRAVAHFTIIENRQRRSSDGGFEDAEPNAFRVEVWGEQAEHVASSSHKGDRLTVEGRIETNRWTDKDTQQERTAQQVTAIEVGFSLKFHTVTSQKADSASDAGEQGDATGSWNVAEIPDGDSPS